MVKLWLLLLSAFLLFSSTINAQTSPAGEQSSNPLLFSLAIKVALESKFRPTILQGLPVKVTGVIVYNFTAQ